MGTKTKTVSFTAQEYVWLCNRVRRSKKVAEAIATGAAGFGKKKDPGILERKDYKMVCKLVPLFPEVEIKADEEYEVTLIPKQLGYVKHFTELNAKHLHEKVLPEYTNRAARDLKYLNHITGTKELIEMLKELAGKVG